MGVISIGISNYENLKRAGILPPGLVVLGDKDTKSDEGDWMLQEVHQIAPRAKLAFCLGSITTKSEGVKNRYKLGVTKCAKKLINDFHANIIVSDVEPYTTKFAFPKGVSELERIHHKHPNVLLFSSSGNYAGNFYRGKWTPMKWSLEGKPALAQSFGKATGRTRRPYNVFRIEIGFSNLVIFGHVKAMGPTRSCPTLPVRLVLMDRHNHLIARARPDDTPGPDCGRVVLRLAAEDTKDNHLNWTIYRNLKKETTYHLALLASPSIKQNDFRIRLRGYAYSASRQSSWGAWFDFFYWRYATSGLESRLAGSADKTGDFSIAALNPYTELHGRYAREPHAGIGPSCYLSSKESHAANKPLSCYQQPMFAAPDLSTVAFPADNKKGYHFAAFTGGSAAAPVVAGAAALLLSAGVPAQQIPGLFERTAVKVKNQKGWNPFYGYGQIDVDASGRAAQVLPRHGKINHSPKPQPAAASGTNASPAEKDYYPVQISRRVAQGARSGSSKAMWQLGNELRRGGYYAWGATLVWWQRAAERKYPPAFCSLGGEYAYTTDEYWRWWWGARPLPYRPRLALALLQTCARLGGGTSDSQPLIARLRSELSGREIAASKTLTDRLMRNPAKYLPSLNYEYVPSSPQ
ncbi:MAG: S8 family serine peptidase [Gammaproteobacteria bacterium]